MSFLLTFICKRTVVQHLIILACMFVYLFKKSVSNEWKKVTSAVNTCNPFHRSIARCHGNQLTVPVWKVKVEIIQAKVNDGGVLNNQVRIRGQISAVVLEGSKLASDIYTDNSFP